MKLICNEIALDLVQRNINVSKAEKWNEKEENMCVACFFHIHARHLCVCFLFCC